MCCEDEDVGSLRLGGSFFLEFHGVQPANTGLVRNEQRRPGYPSPDWHVEEMSHSRKAVEFVGTAE